MWEEARTTARLESVEYRYVNLPSRLRDPGDVGGEVFFDGLPNGTWIVREWRVRTPLMAFIGRTVRMRRIGYHDEGGIVWRATNREGSTVLEAGTGTVTGTLVDSAGQPPSGGALVTTGFGDEARSSANDGSVILGGLAAGLWHLIVSHPSLDTLGLRPELVEVIASLDEVVGFRYRLPSPSQLLVDACGGEPGPPNTTILMGRMRTVDGKSVGRRRFVSLPGRHPSPCRKQPSHQGEMPARLHRCGCRCASGTNSGSKRQPTSAAASCSATCQSWESRLGEPRSC